MPPQCGAAGDCFSGVGGDARHLGQGGVQTRGSGDAPSPRAIANSRLGGGEGRSKTPIGSAIVAMAAAIVTIATLLAAVVEPQQSWS